MTRGHVQTAEKLLGLRCFFFAEYNLPDFNFLLQNYKSTFVLLNQAVSQISHQGFASAIWRNFPSRRKLVQVFCITKKSVCCFLHLQREDIFLSTGITNFFVFCITKNYCLSMFVKCQTLNFFYGLQV